ncbi:LysR substrate-binding domain-containing protein [Nonomuraea roseoviolacea]|uniref:DNA-binding transcriptional LysR family regulator n=2 Tax=Nonomuraea TaxID=83681 RepID=A0ABT1KEV2_9ACTN|nr:DNA-binding transcriptional LysR family regulator [Nonomuraea roseoviolacea subsp. carminata]
MSTSPGRGGLLPAIRSRFTALHPEATVRLRQVGWEDATAGLADGAADVAFVWLPVPAPERYAWTVVAEEPRLVAMPDTHRLAGRGVVDFAELLDEPFLALPESAGPLRDHWLAWTPAAAGRCASARRSPARTRRTRRWWTAAASACWPGATPRS